MKFFEKRRKFKEQMGKGVNKEAITKKIEEEAKIEDYRAALEGKGIIDLEKDIISETEKKDIIPRIDKRDLYDLKKYFTDQNIKKVKDYEFITEYEKDGEKLLTTVGLYATEEARKAYIEYRLEKNNEELALMNKAFVEHDEKAREEYNEKIELNQKYNTVLDEYTGRIKQEFEKEQINATRDVTVPGAVGNKTDIGIEPADS